MKIKLIEESKQKAMTILLLAFTFLMLSTNLSATPMVKDGLLDLRQWDFNQAGSVSLSGTWDFFWKKLIKTDRIKSPKEPLKLELPGSWKGLKVEDMILSEFGYGSYRLKILLSDNMVNVPLGLKIHYAHTAYSLFVNGKKVTSNGIVGKSKEQSVPWLRPHVVSFESTSNELELIFEVSNFHHSSGGVTRILRFGEYQAIASERERSVAVDLFLLGSILIMGLYHLALYSLRRKEKSFLYFAVFCLFASGYTIFTGERTFTMWWTGMDWPLVGKITYQVGFIPFAFFVAYIREIFPNEVSKSGVRFFFALCGIIVFAIAVLPIRTAISVKGYSQYYVVLTLLYVFYIVIRAMLNKRKGSILLFSGLIIFFLSVLNDILLAAGILNTGDFAPFGVFVFFFVQSLLLSRNFTRAFARVEEISEELQVKGNALIESNKKLKEMDQLKDDFLANTSHELRTPLNGIIGIAETLNAGISGDLPDSLKNNLSLIISSGKRLSSLINDILDFSKLKNNQLEIQEKPIDMNTLIETVLLLSLPLVKNGTVKLVNQCSKDIPLVKGDENRLQQVLFNLIGNAIKFTEKGFVTVTGKLVNDKVVISVSDTGIGISGEQKQIIFKYFEQGSAEISSQYGGTGLGLSISQKLLESHGSSLELDSELGKGSTFTFALPISAGNNNETHALIEPAFQPKIESFIPVANSGFQEKFNSNRHILIVDDEPVNQQVISNYLHLFGCSTTSVYSGKEALKYLENKPVPDLILLDIMMPEMNGFEVCKKIRKKYNLTELPIIFLTAKNQLKDLIHGLEIGSNDYLVKPFSKEELYARLQLHLSISDLEKELHKTNESLEVKVLDRTKELQAANHKLNEQFEELQKMQKQLVQSEKMRSLGTLVAGIAHEINNPATFTHLGAENMARRLNDFNSFLNEMISDDAPKELIDRLDSNFKNLFNELEAITEGTRRIETIVQGLKAFVRSSDDSVSTTNIVKEIKSILHLIKSGYNESIEFRISISSDIEIECYPSLLSQVFMNLLINSSQAIIDRKTDTTFNGLVSIDGNLINDNLLEVRFKDNGIGMDESIVPYVFEPFFTTKPVGKGTGLGLSITHGIIEQHHGSIRVESKLGEGTQFIIQLPLKQPDMKRN